jgi:hypothetical protein
MKTIDLDSQIENISKISLDRRKFFRQAGMLGFGAAASGLLLSGAKAQAQESSYAIEDTVAEIFTAFLIAEDLATTFYFNGLSGPVIQDPNLAGPGGSARNITSSGNAGNVNYLQAALIEEIEHANLFRDLLTGAATGASADPYQTFYFPEGTFTTLSTFLTYLNALENAFIGAYLILIQEMSAKAAAAIAGKLTGADAKYSAAEYENFALIGASILGVESEHRVLGRVIGNNNPANNLNYEQLDGLASIYNGPKSAVVALTPFLTPSTGPGYSLGTALADWRLVTEGITTTGGQP